MHNQKKDNKFKNKKQPDLTENKTVWKSDNQEVKEETFNQTCRKRRDSQPSGEDAQQSGGWGTGTGKVAAGRPGETAAGGLSGPTFTCK